MAHSPSYFEQYCRLGGAIRHRGEVDPVVRELAITRTGILCEAPYEVVAHKRIGKNAGVTDEQNEALENWKSATCFNELQRAALAFTDEIVRLHRPTDATFNAIASKLTPAALVELQLSVGFYIMTSKFLETFAIDMRPVTEVACQAACAHASASGFEIASTCPSATTSSMLTRIDLSVPAAGEATGISIFIASTNAMSSPSPMRSPISTGSAQTRPATSVTILISGIPISGTAAARTAIEMRAS